MNMSCDVTVVINAHREGLLLYPTLLSALRCKDAAVAKGVRCEIIIVLDNPDQATAKLVDEFSDPFDLARYQVSFGDLGKSRNFGIQKAKGAFLAFLDGDDLWCESWLYLAFAQLVNADRILVLHPEFNLYFGHSAHIFHHVDMDEPLCDVTLLALTNMWTSLCFAPLALFEQCPYPETDLKRNLGYEDWGWNMKVIAAGGVHKTVKNTFHAIRTKEVSLLKQTTAAGCFPARPAGLFDRDLP